MQLFKNPKIVRPSGHGCYGPSIALCEQMLSVNDLSSCALAIMILSDGRPSDPSIMKMNPKNATKYIIQNIESIASKYGRRLTVNTVGIGAAEEFSTLQNISNSANNYESSGKFHLPSASCSSLGVAISSVATSLTASQTELTVDYGSGSAANQQRQVRPVKRENKTLIPVYTEAIDTNEFHVYMGEDVHHMK